MELKVLVKQENEVHNLAVHSNIAESPLYLPSYLCNSRNLLICNVYLLYCYIYTYDTIKLKLLWIDSMYSFDSNSLMFPNIFRSNARPARPGSRSA